MVRTVIFVARQDDIHADAVLDRCSRRGADVARFEMASPLRDNMKFEIVIDRQQTKWELLLGSHRVSDTDNLAVFCRDWEMSDRASAEELEQCVKNEEARAFLNAWAGLVPHSRWLDHPTSQARWDNKLLQTALASSIGFKTPKTIATNDPETVRNAARTNRLVIKNSSAISHLMVWIVRTSSFSQPH